MKLRVARARPSEVLDGPALVAFVVAKLATRAEVLVRLATVEVETAEFPADAKMLRGAPALADVVRFEVATDALVRNGTTIVVVVGLDLDDATPPFRSLAFGVGPRRIDRGLALDG